MNEITQSAYEADLRKRFAEIAAQKAAKKSKWDDEKDAALLSARDEFGLTFEEIGAEFKRQYGWGHDKAMIKRYKELKAAGR